AASFGYPDIAFTVDRYPRGRSPRPALGKLCPILDGAIRVGERIRGLNVCRRDMDPPRGYHSQNGDDGADQDQVKTARACFHKLSFQPRKLPSSDNSISGTSSAMKWLLGSGLPTTFEAPSFQVSRTLYCRCIAPLSAHSAKTGQLILRCRSASSCIRSMEAPAR